MGSLLNLFECWLLEVLNSYMQALQRFLEQSWSDVITLQNNGYVDQ